MSQPLGVLFPYPSLAAFVVAVAQASGVPASAVTVNQVLTTG